MQKTSNLNLNKPDGTDIVDIANLNANMDIIDGKLGTTGHDHTGTAGNGPKITSTGLAAGAADDVAIGSRTVNQALASPANTGTITQLLSWMAGRNKAITGGTNWYDAPAITLAAINTLFGTSGHSHNGITGQGPKIAFSNIDGAPSSMTPTAHASTTTTYGVSNASNYGHAMASSVPPLAAGIAIAGTDNGKFAREGHVHPAQTAVTGNAGTVGGYTAEELLAAAGFDAGHSFTENGWQKLSNGLILQWGRVLLSGSKWNDTFTFPIAFPSKCLYAIACPTNDDPYNASAPEYNTTAQPALCYRVTKTNCYVKAYGTNYAGYQLILLIGY